MSVDLVVCDVVVVWVVLAFDCGSYWGDVVDSPFCVGVWLGRVVDSVSIVSVGWCDCGVELMRVCCWWWVSRGLGCSHG